MNLATNIQSRRKKRKLLQRELAAAAGVSRLTVVTSEAGRTTPTLRTLRKLAKGLGCEVSELLAG